jgi:hypothetical protein
MSRRVVSIALFVTATAVMALVLHQLPDGITMERHGLLPVFALTPSRAEVDSVVAARRAVLDRVGDGDTYLPTMLAQRDSFLFRWPERNARPLQVYVRKDGAYVWEFERPVREAFARWQEFGGIPVLFRFLADPVDAEIVVQWADSIAPVDGKSPAGTTAMDGTSDGWYRNGIVTIAVRHLGSARLRAPQDIHATALHEVGHVLGLLHSDRPEDVMWGTGARDISARDLRTLRLLYDLPPGWLSLAVW